MKLWELILLSFLVLPKIIVNNFISYSNNSQCFHWNYWRKLVGGQSVGVLTSDFIQGLQYEFIPFYVTYSIIKTIVFAFLITSISSYFGYHTKGGGNKCWNF